MARRVLCGRPVRLRERPGAPVLGEVWSSCGLTAGHRCRCRSVEAVRRNAAATAYSRRVTSQAPSGSPAVAAVIASARKGAGLSRARLALALGVTERAVEYWETARRTPGAGTWVQLELTLGPLGVVREAGEQRGEAHEHAA